MEGGSVCFIKGISQMNSQISPHGGQLRNRLVTGAEREELLQRSSGMRSFTLSERELADLDMIACGAMSPLEGFMIERDYRQVLEDMHLADGTLWSIPVVFSVSGISDPPEAGSEICLKNATGKPVAIISVEDVFSRGIKNEAVKVYGTDDENHPGVASLFKSGEVCIGGKVKVLNRQVHNDFEKYRLDPSGTRELFASKGWATIVAFQTRNPIHRAHEYLQKCALEIVDGILIHPLVGETKGDDIPAADRIRTYEIIMKEYYPADRSVMTVFPATMRYAGPREAIFHAICRQNYGCTHFIVGRDHAGVGNYYGTYDAQNIFRELRPGELTITPLFFENSFYCRKCEGMATAKTCPHGKEERVFLSGTEVRRLLSAGEMLPVEMTRPEVSAVLIEAMKNRK